MQSKRLDYSHRRQHSDRSSRQWDDYDHRWEERRETRREASQDFYQKHFGDGHISTERTSRCREYSDSPNTVYNKESLNRVWNKKSSARKCMSSPDRGTSEKKRQRFTEDDEDDYRYRREPEVKTNRQSPDSFSRAYANKDFKHKLPKEEDFKYRKTPQDSRHRYRYEESSYRQQYDDCRQSSGYCKDQDRPKRSQERTHSRDRSTKQSYAKSRDWNDNPSTDHDDYRQNRSRFPLNGSNGQSFGSDYTNQSADVPEPKKSAEGFQRFLDVLNKGVNVATLTKIVAQPPAQVGDRPCSPTSFVNTDQPWSTSCSGWQQGNNRNTSHWSESEESHGATLTTTVPQPRTEVGDKERSQTYYTNTDRLWSPTYSERQQGSHQNTSYWGKSEESQRRLASPQPRHRSFSPTGSSLSEEKSLQRGGGEQRYFSSNSRSMSPSVVEKITLTPEDEHKHRQMLDVLQAIGVDLGSEELGQMSHRIQERLYGKKDSDHHHRVSRERNARRVISPRPRSRSSSSSSSSRSSCSPLKEELYKKKDAYGEKKDAYSAQTDVTDVQQVQVHEAVEYGKNTSSSTSQKSEKLADYSQQSTAACQAFPQNSVNTLSKPFPTPALPKFPPVNCTPLPFPALPPNFPPNLPHLGPRLFLPRLPPFFPYPRVPPVPPLNILPAVLAQTSHLLPQHFNNRPFFNMPGINPIQPLNTTQKPKPLSRPRCLQVIETKQPG